MADGAPGSFPFVQFEFGFLLGPPDGRFLVRDDPEAPIGQVLVMETLGAPERRFRDRRGRSVTEAEPEPVPTSRVTIVDAQPLAPGQAGDHLAALRRDQHALDATVAAALVILNRALAAHRVARADTAVRDVTSAHALVVRVGHGNGDEVAHGRYADAWQLPLEGPRKRRRSMEAPDERFAALLSGREHPIPAEELILRARADMTAGRIREAALETRVALESLLATLPDAASRRRPRLEEARGPVGRAANAALEGMPSADLAAALETAIAEIEMALRAARLGSAS